VASLILARRARQELLDLNRPLIDAVEDALGMLERDPQAGHELRGRLRGLRSLRVGTYRIIYQLTDDQHTVRVAAIRHRSTAPPAAHSATENAAGGMIVG
jgi:mRNA interferase RelE/StbE